MPLTPTTRLGAYEIVARLGAGGMGEVYRARDTRLSRDVAIKALPEAFIRDADRLSRFRREAQTLAALNHSNVATIYGLEESDGAPYLVLELVEGETLAQRLARGPLPIRDALILGIQVAAAIEAAHERGIIHRDLKPGNVMITSSGTAKVLDFGLAKSDSGATVGADLTQSPTIAAGTVAGVILGTAAYMSPEQARGLSVDRRSDVWSFGCVLYECLAGRPAFTGATASDLIAKILEREPDWSALPAGTPAAMREILRRSLRKETEARPRDIRDVRLELEAIASGSTQGTARREKSIAVLPFENQGGSDDDYFSDGVTDEILNALAQVEGLRVAARTSCFAFKGQRQDLRQVAEKLDVGTVLEGTVRRSGSRLRITVQMVNAADGYQLWSERYDREMTDVFAVQEEIANTIATRLRGDMHADKERARARGGTRNLEAYELLLRGRALQTRRGRFLPQAAACFERAIALDPQYTEALAWLADSYRLMGTFGAKPSEVMPRAKDLAERALAIDDRMVHAWMTLASVAEQYERDFARSEELYIRALTLDPRHSQARAQRGLWRAIRLAMPMADALAELERAVEDDPLNSWVAAMRSYLLGIAGRHEDSIVEAERAVALDDESFFAQWTLVRAHAWAGHYEQAFQQAPALLGGSGRHQWAVGLLGWTYGRAGRIDLARACHDELEARSRLDYVAPSWLAITARSGGLADESIRWCERAVLERDPLVLWAKTLPFWESFHADRRFQEITRGLWG
ncbi:MAG TPA: protein kinase [Candidatus Eisenbacteria bacterium]|nr:protein kinase [Candidatus Eisenbacteria bacterium]